MRINRFNINESEKNRMRKLHKKFSIIKEQDDTVNSEDMIQGISVGNLSPGALNYLKNDKTISLEKMLRHIAGCYDDDYDTFDGQVQIGSTNMRPNPATQNEVIWPGGKVGIIKVPNKEGLVMEATDICTLSNVDEHPILSKIGRRTLSKMLDNWLEESEHAIYNMEDEVFETDDDGTIEQIRTCLLKWIGTGNGTYKLAPMTQEEIVACSEVD